MFCFQQVGRPLIDIKPGNDLNRVNVCARGVLPVAILSFDTFDATELDPSTVYLAEAGVKRVDEDKWLTHTRDVDKDGKKDLVVDIVNEDLALESGDTEAILIGKTFDGTPVQGTDAVEVEQRMCMRTLQ